MRFFAVKEDMERNRIRPLTDEILTECLENMTSPKSFNAKKEYRVFCETFYFIRRVLSEKAFVLTGPCNGEFSQSAYDQISARIALHIDDLERHMQRRVDESFGNKIEQLKEWLDDNPSEFAHEMLNYMDEYMKGVKKSLDRR